MGLLGRSYILSPISVLRNDNENGPSMNLIVCHGHLFSVYQAISKEGETRFQERVPS